MSNGVALSRKCVRRALRAQHPDWTSILHDVKKAYLTNTVPLSFYDQFHRQLDILLEKRPREDGDDDEDEEEREEQAKRPRVEIIPSYIPEDMLFEIFSNMPWYHIYASRDISNQFRTLIDNRVLRTIRKIAIDDEDPDQISTGYNFPKMLKALINNPKMPRDTLTTLTVSRTVFPAGYNFGGVDVHYRWTPDLYETAVMVTFHLHWRTLHNISVRGLSVVYLMMNRPFQSSPPPVILDTAHTVDIKPLCNWRFDAIKIIRKSLRENSSLKELRYPYAIVYSPFVMTSNAWSVFPTRPTSAAKGFSDTSQLSHDTIRQWSDTYEHLEFGHGYEFELGEGSDALSLTAEHVHFYSTDTAYSFIRNAEKVYRANNNLVPAPPFVDDYMLFPNLGKTVPNAISVVFDGPYDVWSDDDTEFDIGNKCQILTGTANFWSIIISAPSFTSEMRRACVFDSFSGNGVEPRKEFSVHDIAVLCPNVQELYVQRSPAFAGMEERAGVDISAGHPCKAYHVGPIPIAAMKNIGYSVFNEINTATRNTEGSPYRMDINEKSRTSFETLYRSYDPYFAVGAFTNLERVSFWWTDKSDRDQGLRNPEKIASMLEGLENLHQICIVDGNELFSKILAMIGHTKYEFALLQSKVLPLPPTIDDATMRTQRCYLWPVDDDTIRTMVDVDDLHPDTKINGRYAREWIDQMEEVPY